MKINFEKIKELNFSTNEAYKTLRTNIMFCGDDIKTITVTSSLPNEGKSEVSFFLSKAFSEGGYKTLFIDDLCVDSNKRGMNIGSSLISYVKDWPNLKDDFDSHMQDIYDKFYKQ